MRRLIFVLCALLGLSASAAPVYAQPAKEQLKAQFKEREAEVRDLKKKGQIGETVEGYVDAVDPKAAGDQKVSKLLADENKDRRALYQLLADEINKENPKEAVKATVDTIAVRNAQRNIERAGQDEFLRVEREHWIRVKDYPRFQKLTKLKTQGKVGETGEGKVEIVQEADRGDKTISSLVEEENTRRAAEYKALAEKEKTDAASIAQRMGRRNIENARIGDMVKDKGGAWRKK
jgi:uncharacterized protein YdbL (DUF1318 family)